MNQTKITDKERLEIARRNIGRVIENDQLESYPKGQLGVALQIVEKYRNVLGESNHD